MSLLRHALLALSVAAVSGTGWRLAGRLTAEPLERALAAAPIAACAAVLGALALGRAGLAAEPLALTGLAVAGWLVVPRSPGPAPRMSRVAAGLLFGLAVWLLARPALGVDGISYHLPEVLTWLQSGDTGATPTVAVEFPVGSYPLTNEVLLAWAMGIAGSFSPVALWTAGAVGLLCLGGWVGLRRLDCSPAVTLLAIAALLTTPVLVGQLNAPKTDIPSVAWLVVGAGLVATRRPALLGPALAAAGLAVGSKTTAAPLAVLVLAAGWWIHRASLRQARTPIIWGLVAAVGVGGVWFLRNQIAHGWALWPFGSGPFGGDAEPVYLQRIDASFLERPGYTLDGRTGAYAEVLAGGLLLAAGGVAAAAVQRSRLVLAASAATALAALAWMAAPFTGRTADPFLDLSLTTTRYLLPVLAAGAAALALAARRSRLARALLAVALAWNVVGVLQLPADTPPLWTLVAGVAMVSVVSLGGRWALAGAAVVVAAVAADGYVQRVADTGATVYAPLAGYFAALPGWDDDDAPVAFVQNVVAPVAGDELRHPLVLIDPDESCARTLERTREGWVVMRDLPPAIRARLAPVRAPGCLAGLEPVARAGEWLVYRQTATTSSALSRSAVPSVKSPTPIAASSGV